MTREALQHPTAVDLALYSGGDCGFLQKWRIGRHLASLPGESRRDHSAPDSSRDEDELADLRAVEHPLEAAARLGQR